jgi:hypothetical protein
MNWFKRMFAKDAAPPVAPSRPAGNVLPVKQAASDPITESRPRQDLDDLANLTLQQLESSGIGMSFRVPESWEDVSTKDHFGVYDSENDTTMIVNAYSGDYLSLHDWAKARLAAVGETMPYLQALSPPYLLDGSNWRGVMAEYRGVCPGDAFQTRYLVLCIVHEGMLIAFTMTTHDAVFLRFERTYRWLITKQLSFHKRLMVGIDSVVPILIPARNVGIDPFDPEQVFSPDISDDANALHEKLLGDMAIGYTTLDANDGKLLSRQVITSLGIPYADVYSVAVNNLYREVRDFIRIERVKLTPEGDNDAAAGGRDIFFSVSTDISPAAGCLLLPPLLERIRSLVSGDPVIAVPKENLFIFSGSGHMQANAIASVAAHLAADEPERRLSGCLFRYHNGDLKVVPAENAAG